MIRINLLPSKDTERALGDRNIRSLFILGVVLLIFILVVPWVIQNRRIESVRREISSVEIQLERYSEQVREVEHLDDLKAELEMKLGVIGQLERKKVGPARMLQDLGTSTPEKLWITELNEAGAKTRVRGVAIDNETIAEFMRQLEASPYFDKVDLEEIREERSESQIFGFKLFTLNASVNYLGPAAENGTGSGSTEAGEAAGS